MSRPLNWRIKRQDNFAKNDYLNPIFGLRKVTSAGKAPIATGMLDMCTWG